MGDQTLSRCLWISQFLKLVHGTSCTPTGSGAWTRTTIRGFKDPRPAFRRRRNDSEKTFHVTEFELLYHVITELWTVNIDKSWVKLGDDSLMTHTRLGSLAVEGHPARHESTFSKDVQHYL